MLSISPSGIALRCCCCITLFYIPSKWLGELPIQGKYVEWFLHMLAQMLCNGLQKNINNIKIDLLALLFCFWVNCCIELRSSQLLVLLELVLVKKLGITWILLILLRVCLGNQLNWVLILLLIPSDNLVSGMLTNYANCAHYSTSNLWGRTPGICNVFINSSSR